MRYDPGYSRASTIESVNDAIADLTQELTDCYTKFVYLIFV